MIKDIPGYEGLYSITDEGQVLAHPREVKCKAGATRMTKGRVLKPCITNRGYEMVNLCRDYKQDKRTVHRLVAEAFVVKGEGCTEVDHVDGIKIHNDASNLEWVTSSQNTRRWHAQRGTLI